MSKSLLAPSMMCMDLARTEETLKTFKEYGVDYLHMDVMDGEFVPNYALGTDFCNQLRKLTNIPLDIHLMIERPDLKIDRFNIQPGEIVAVHWESTPHVPRVLSAIREKGAKPFLAINPATPVDVIDHLIDAIDGVLVMTVNPGFAGQPMYSSALRKIRQVREFLDSHDSEDALIEVDGNVSFEHAAQMREAGADIFVGGSSSVFFKGASMADNLMKMNRVIGKE